jgi:hypothetical protein
MRARFLFVLGSPRSGTSTLVRFVRDHFDAGGEAEGHVFTLLRLLHQAVRQHCADFQADPPSSQSTLGRIGSERLLAAVDAAILDALPPAETAWRIDKTPGPQMIEFAPALARRLPDSRFLYLYRNGVANVDSRLRKFPTVPFELHCIEWSNCILHWLDGRRSIDPARYLELSLESLVEDPQRAATAIARLLETSIDPSRVGAVPHLERTRAGGSLAWSDARKRTFRTICGAAMRMLELPFDALDDAAARHPEPVALLPPIGQRDVELRVANPSYCAPRVRDAGTEIFLHPASPEETPSAIVYRNVELGSRLGFRARVLIENPLSAEVRFALRLCDGHTGAVLQERSITCSAGHARDWSETLDPVDGCCDVQLSTEMAEGGPNHNAWAFFANPRFEA